MDVVTCTFELRDGRTLSWTGEGYQLDLSGDAALTVTLITGGIVAIIPFTNLRVAYVQAPTQDDDD